MIVWDGLVTFLILRGIGLFMKLREPDEVLIAGDIALHGEVAYPKEEPDVRAPRRRGPRGTRAGRRIITMPCSRTSTRHALNH